MPDATIEHDTIEDARTARAEPIEGKAPPEDPEPGPIKQIRQAMRDKMAHSPTGEKALADDDPWLSVENEAIWTVHK